MTPLADHHDHHHDAGGDDDDDDDVVTITMTSVVMNLASTTTMIVKNMIPCLECIVFLELFGFDRFGRKISLLSLPTVQADSALKDP